jgi:hypothetical protein
MKTIFIVGILFLQLIACDKAEYNAQLVYLDYIIAGQTSGIGIKYTDIEPNDTFSYKPTETFKNRSIDLNDDSINDFVIYFSGSSSPIYHSLYSRIIPLNNNTVAIPDFENNIADTIDLNDTIDNNLHWANDTCILYGDYWYRTYEYNEFSSTKGLWNNVKNKFIGTKVFLDDKTLYGWIRVEIKDGWQLIILDYACTIGYEKQ